MKAIIIPLVVLLFGGQAWAQPTMVLRRSIEANPTNAAPDAQELALTNDISSSDELTETNEVADTNGPAEKASASGSGAAASPRDLRKSRDLFEQRKAAHANRTTGAAAAPDPGAGGSAKVEFSAFSLIVERNIFDPTRQPHKKGVIEAPPPVTESFALVGTMSYDKGTFAFFKGTSSRYEKALKLSDSIAGFKLTAIAPNTVKLATSTNELDLAIGSQMRRVEDGPWKLSTESSSFASSTPSSTSSGTGSSTRTDAAPTGSESDILKKLMQRREQE